MSLREWLRRVLNIRSPSKEMKKNEAEIVGLIASIASKQMTFVLDASEERSAHERLDHHHLPWRTSPM